MLNLNKLMLGGCLTRDPEPIAEGRGCRVGLAVNERRQVDGVWQDHAEFFDVTVWNRQDGGKQATQLMQTLRKGMSIFMECRLKVDKWEDRSTGEPRSKLAIVCTSWQYVERKPQQAATTTPQRDAEEDNAPAPTPPTQRQVAAEITRQATRAGRKRKPNAAEEEALQPAAAGDDVPF